MSNDDETAAMRARAEAFARQRWGRIEGSDIDADDVAAKISTLADFAAAEVARALAEERAKQPRRCKPECGMQVRTGGEGWVHADGCPFRSPPTEKRDEPPRCKAGCATGDKHPGCDIPSSPDDDGDTIWFCSDACADAGYSLKPTPEAFPPDRRAEPMADTVEASAICGCCGGSCRPGLLRCNACRDHCSPPPADTVGGSQEPSASADVATAPATETASAFLYWMAKVVPAPTSEAPSAMSSESTRGPKNHRCGACESGRHQDCSGWCFCPSGPCDRPKVPSESIAAPISELTADRIRKLERELADQKGQAAHYMSISTALQDKAAVDHDSARVLAEVVRLKDEEIRELAYQVKKLEENIPMLHAEADEMRAERDHFKADLNAELAGNAALRARFGARDNETMPMFHERLVAERDAAIRDRDAAVLAERERCAKWIAWRKSRPGPREFSMFGMDGAERQRTREILQRGDLEMCDAGIKGGEAAPK